jgi:MFS family permease
MPLLSGVALLLGVATNAGSSSATAAMALTTSNERRGAVAGYLQCGQLGGVGLGGGLGLWLAEHGGGQAVAGLTLAALCALCALPILYLRVPPRLAGVSVSHRLKDVGAALWTLARTRSGVLAILANILPASLGAAGQLLSTVAGDWHASADLVALVLGAVTGVANLPGCLIGGYLCDLFPRRTVYILSALACALGEAAMAFGPHTPAWFAAFAVLNAVLLGLSWAAVSAVCFEQLGARAAATVAAVLSSISNLPVVIMIAVVGSVQAKHGSSGMLLIEAGFGVASVILYAAVVAMWKPAGTGALQSAAAPA